MQEVGGPLIFSFRLARLVACFALLGTSIAALLNTGDWQSGIGQIDNAKWLRIALTLVYVRLSHFSYTCTGFDFIHQLYTCILSIVSISTSRVTSNSATRHLALVLLATWFVFAYRDLWPLATFSLRPIDEAYGPLMWVEIAFLTFAGVLVPLLIPRQYVPVDPKVSYLHPHDGQQSPYH